MIVTTCIVLRCLYRISVRVRVDEPAAVKKGQKSCRQDRPGGVSMKRKLLRDTHRDDTLQPGGRGRVT